MVHALKAFAPVKKAQLAVHPVTGVSLRACYVEFASVDLAEHTIETARSRLTVDDARTSLAFAAIGVPPGSPAVVASTGFSKGSVARTSSESAMRAYQGGQAASRLAKLEGDEVGEAEASVAATVAAATAAEAAATARARVHTGSGAGMGSLAVAFGSAAIPQWGGGDAGGGGYRGSGPNREMGQGAPPEVKLVMRSWWTGCAVIV